MVQTRAQGKVGAQESGERAGSSHTAQKIPEKRSHSKTEASNTSKKAKANKKPKSEETKDEKPESTASKADAASRPKVATLIEKYGSLPLSDTAVDEPLSSKPETLLALLLNAMFSSARISHELAAKTLATSIKAGYHKIEVLKKSSWEERTQVLTEGGYTRYREKTATALGELVDFIEQRYRESHLCFRIHLSLLSICRFSHTLHSPRRPYTSVVRGQSGCYAPCLQASFYILTGHQPNDLAEGDLNNLLPGSATDSSPSEVRKRLKEIKGLGDVGVDIFFDTAQGVWPCLAPFIDPRSAKTADAIGIPSDPDVLWESNEVAKDPTKMARLAAALTTVRLEKKESEFKKGS